MVYLIHLTCSLTRTVMERPSPGAGVSLRSNTDNSALKLSFPPEPRCTGTPFMSHSGALAFQLCSIYSPSHFATDSETGRGQGGSKDLCMRGSGTTRSSLLLVRKRDSLVGTGKGATAGLALGQGVRGHCRPLASATRWLCVQLPPRVLPFQLGNAGWSFRFRQFPDLSLIP